jgi:hypothetical protein
MPMTEYLYHGQAVGFEADIWEPGPHKIDGHARCGVPDKKAGKYNAQQNPFEIPKLLSHAGCTSEVIAHPEDKDGFFRTEVRATVGKLSLEGDALTADRITLGLVSVYRRQWFDNGKPHGQRVRVVPYGCSIENLAVKGQPLPDLLPAPFHYSTDRCEAYLRGDDPDLAAEAEIRKAITESPSRFKYVKNFGRIFIGEWTLLPSDDWHPIHQIYMLRLAMGSPQTGNGGGGGGQVNGTPG